MQRKKIVNKIVEVISEIKLEHPLRVGIDGVGASGKTHFADDLAVELRAKGKSVIRASIDGFHNPPEIRRRQGTFSSTGYFEDSFNYNEVIRNILKPLGPKGNLEYIDSIYNFVDNKTTTVSKNKASKNDILIFEGVFLFNQFLFPYWDYKLFIDATFEETFRRAEERDVKRLGGINKLTKLYNERYIPGQKYYLHNVDPISKADIVINNNNYKMPFIAKHNRALQNK